MGEAFIWIFIVALIVWCGVAIAMPSQSKVRQPSEKLSKHNSELIQLFVGIFFIVFMVFIFAS
jgi:hypothetical protein